MRKIDPAGVLADFELQLNEQDAFFSWIRTRKNGAKYIRLAAENYALTLGVIFEGYINDLLIAYINRDCSRLGSHLLSSLSEHLSKNPKLSTAFKTYGSLTIPKHISKTDLQAMLDPDGRNVAFPTFSAMRSQAQHWLAHEHFEKFRLLPAESQAIIDLSIALRNNLAHRSKNSFDVLNERLKVGALHNSGLRRGDNRVNDPARFLCVKLPDGQARIDCLAGKLLVAAQLLV